MNLEQRVQLLERQNRRYRHGLAVGLVLVGTIAALGPDKPAQPPEKISAARFVLVDGNGRERGWFGLEDGAPEFVMTNASGREVVRLEVPTVPDKPALYMSDPAERARLELALTQTGPVLHFNDAAGTRLRLATNELNAPLMAVYDQQARPVFEVTSQGFKPGK